MDLIQPRVLDSLYSKPVSEGKLEEQMDLIQPRVSNSLYSKPASEGKLEERTQTNSEDLSAHAIEDLVQKVEKDTKEDEGNVNRKLFTTQSKFVLKRFSFKKPPKIESNG